MTRLQVLVVEDDGDMRFVLAESLRHAGLVVHEAGHGQHALDLVAAGFRPGLILLDIVMPVMDGFTFLRRKETIRDLTDVPVIVVTATAEPPIEGACCVLRKPVDPSPRSFWRSAPGQPDFGHAAGFPVWT
jgi:CheY-like chemotaxis protein